MLGARVGTMLLVMGFAGVAQAAGEEGDAPRLSCRVEEVLTGSSLIARCGEERLNVFLYCIEAPRLGQQPWGEQSREALKKLLGEEVELREFPIPRSTPETRRERTIAELFRGGKSINIEMVTQGDAAVHPRWCVETRFLEAEAIAQAGSLGIWSKPGHQQRPWENRENAE